MNRAMPLSSMDHKEIIPVGNKRMRLGSSSINDLPLELLVIIFSFLETIDVIRTSSLAKCWRYLWKRVPVLAFSSTYFFNTISMDPIRHMRFIERIIQHRQRSGGLHQFLLHIDYYKPILRSQVNSWIQYAIENNVKVLDLKFSSYSSFVLLRKGHEFCLEFLKDNSVRVLKLRCSLFAPVSKNCICTSLRKLLLEFCVLKQKALDSLLKCSSLVDLEIISSGGLKYLKIKSMFLQRLALRHWKDDEGSIEIIAPKLLVFECECFAIGSYDLRGVPSSVRARFVLPSCIEYLTHWRSIAFFLQYMEHLIIQSWWFKIMSPMEAFSWILVDLKHLELETGFLDEDVAAMLALLIICPNIQTLVLSPNSYSINNFIGIIPSYYKYIQLPLFDKMELIRIIATKEIKSQLCFLWGLIQSSPKLQKVEVIVDNRNGITMLEVICQIHNMIATYVVRYYKNFRFEYKEDRVIWYPGNAVENGWKKSVKVFEWVGSSCSMG